MKTRDSVISEDDIARLAAPDRHFIAGQRQAVAVRLVDKISGDADLLIALEQRGHAERRNKQREHGHYPPRRIAEYERYIYIHESTSDNHND